MKIVVLDGYAANPGDLSWEALAAQGDLTVYDRTPPEEICARIGDADAVFTNKTVLTRSHLEQCPNLKLVSVLATGYNVVDLAAARELGITVCNVPAYSTGDVAQLTFALLLEVCHHVGHHSQTVREGRWSVCADFCYWDYAPQSLCGKTLGLVGYGQIGRAVAALGQAFGMKVLVHTRTPHPEEEREGLRFVPLMDLLAWSDVVSLHCPLTAENAEMICEETLAAMKDGAVLLNTARGGLVKESALAAALNSGKLSAAAVDVVSREPISPDNPLLTAKNCFITPHIAWATREARSRLLAVSAENLRQFCLGTPQNVVN